MNARSLLERGDPQTLVARNAKAEREQLTVVARDHQPRDAAVRRALALADAVGVATALLISFFLFEPSQSLRDFLLGLASLPALTLVFKVYGLYDRDIKRVSHTTTDDIPWLVHALLVGSVGLWLLYKALPSGGVHFTFMLAFAAVAFVNVLCLRWAARRAVLAAVGPERVALLGEEKVIALLARKMRSHPEYGLEPIGVVTSSQEPPPSTLLPVIGDVHSLDLATLVNEHAIERLVVSHMSVEEPLMLELVHRCKELSLKVSVLPQFFDAMGPSLAVDDVEGITVLGINPPVLPRSSRLVKRSMDVAGAAVLLLIAAPVFLGVALAVKIDSRGPVFFRQQRIGRQGRRFRLLKFRTMVENAEAMTAALAAQSEDPHWLKLREDPRITPVGRWLRLRSLDELPQLWNVLKGEMSLVGPRPLIEREDQAIIGWARGRIDLTPGLTGLWQVLGRTNIPFAEMVKLDYLYVTNWSLWTDIRLILRTVPAVFTQRGAN